MLFFIYVPAMQWRYSNYTEIKGKTVSEALQILAGPAGRLLITRAIIVKEDCAATAG